MRSLLHAALLALVVAVPAGARDATEPPAIRLPNLPGPGPIPGGVVKLTGDTLYVIDCKVDCLVRAHPAGLVTVSKKKGARDITARFVDGVGIEDRTFDGPFLFVVKAAGKGRVELDVIPLGLKNEADIVAATIDVDSGEAPRPPPGPGPVPPPVPTPEPATDTAAHVSIVICEETANRTPQQGKVMFDADLRKKIATGGHSLQLVEVSDKPFEMNGFKPYADKVGYPAVLLFDLDKKGAQIPLAAFKLPDTVAEFESRIWKAVKK